jgi:PhoPQ-activated pathogenicity-related protein
MVRHFAAVCVLLFLVPFAVRAGLPEYVKKAEPDFSWKIEKTDKLGTGTIYTIHLVSQTWQGIKWDHKLLVLQPKNVKPAETMLLINTGGAPTGAMQIIGLELVKRIGSPVAILFGVPNQPLFDGKKEDALIAETFVRFLDGQGKDESWPLLFPMVKSVVKAMDVLQAFAKQEWNHELKSFIVSGGSKRGWTSWLTGASDERVKAIAPMVIDTLNMKPQMEHQIECFGKPSEMVKDYVERGLIPMPPTAEAKRLWSMVDPYFYRDKLKMPKFILNGANDPYWTTDALNLYWDDLQGEKYVCITPNAGHDLQEMPENGKPDLVKSRARTLNGISAFVKHQISGAAMPKVTWEHNNTEDGKLRLYVHTNPPPKTARLWVATSDNKDFRKSRWMEKEANITGAGKLVVGVVPPPEKGCLALYGEVEYEIDGVTYSLSTQMRVCEKK